MIVQKMYDCATKSYDLAAQLYDCDIMLPHMQYLHNVANNMQSMIKITSMLLHKNLRSVTASAIITGHQDRAYLITT